MNKLLAIQRNAKLCTGLRNSHASTPRETVADVVIVGGGMVGTSLACALGCSDKLHDRKIVILEASDKQKLKNWSEASFENRVSSITPGSQTFLKDIGVWDKIAARRYHPYKDMYVWDAASSGNIYLNAEDVNAANMAYIVENSVVVESCIERAEDLSSRVTQHFNAKIEDVSLPGIHDTSNLATVKLHNGDIFKAKLLVGADGPSSHIRENIAKIQTYDYDYRQSAVVATLCVKGKNHVNNTAWQRFLPTGPVALLPLSHDVSSLVWSTTKEHAKQLMKDSDEVFIDKINNAFLGHSTQDDISQVGNNVMSKVISIIEPGFLSSNYVSHPPLVRNLYPRSRGMFPLLLKHSPQYVKTRMALVGDAAHRIHPMAGLGVNLGFGDVKRLVKAIETSVDVGEDYGCLEELLPYETDRQRHVVGVISAINGLHQLFSTTIPPVVLLRTLGLHITNHFNPVKEQIVKYAMQ